VISFLRKLLNPCKHLRVRESMACDAICRDCHRNIGFIGAWRDANRGNPKASEVSNDPSDWYGTGRKSRE
jgi:hypothetical protein